jgi:hypothetical protein
MQASLVVNKVIMNSTFYDRRRDLVNCDGRSVSQMTTEIYLFPRA